MNRGLLMLVLFRVLRLFSVLFAISALQAAHATAATVTLVDDSFDSGAVSSNSRIRTNQADGAWYKNTVSEWTISAGSLSNAGTATSVVSEGALSKIVATDSLSDTLTDLNISFDYTVGATSTLRFALVGYKANLQDGGGTSNILMNNGTSNGSLQNDTQAEFRHGDLNLLTGADMGQVISSGGIAFAAGTTGSYMNTIDLTGYSWSADEAADALPTNSPGLSGSIGSVADFDYIAIVFQNDLSTATGASTTSLQSFSLTASSATAVPEPCSLAVLGMGMTGFAWRRRRRVRKVASTMACK